MKHYTIEPQGDFMKRGTELLRPLFRVKSVKTGCILSVGHVYTPDLDRMLSEWDKIYPRMGN